MQINIELTDEQVDALRHERTALNYEEKSTKEYFIKRCEAIVANAVARKAEHNKSKLAERMAKINPAEVEAFIASREPVA